VGHAARLWVSLAPNFDVSPVSCITNEVEDTLEVSTYECLNLSKFEGVSQRHGRSHKDEFGFAVAKCQEAPWTNLLAGFGNVATHMERDGSHTLSKVVRLSRGAEKREERI
jgi:hypothetical protein